jgi:hypothetical protein
MGVQLIERVDAMSMKPQVCPKCQGEMVQGFVPDYTHARILISGWVEGPPAKSFWYGTKVPGQPIPIATFRCAGCGFLESYAQAEFGAR